MHDNLWMLLIPTLVLVLVTAPVFAWMNRINERQRREGKDRDPKSR